MAEDQTDTGVVLGFVEGAEPWRLQSPQFPSKVGGKPAWLSQTDLPSDLTCEQCRRPRAFLLQVYAPIAGQDRSFHRTLFIFCCKTPACYSHNDSRSFKVYRSQLHRKNDFYPYEPPPEAETEGDGSGDFVLGSGLKLCRVCGCLGTKTCSRCHHPNYCSKEHQTLDWRAGHKKQCSSNELSNADLDHGFLFPESELVTEPEEQPVQDTEVQTEPPEENAENLEFSLADDDTGASESSVQKDLEDMAMHETVDSKVIERFKQRTSLEPHQVLRYCRNGSPLWVSAEHHPQENEIPHCVCGAKRVFELQVMPQLLNHLKVDAPGASIDWGTLAVYTCAQSCDQGNRYTPEFLWKQDFSADHR
ncbi:PDCD2 protein, partial [Amia calva]|nr:PDCD2 protein [Amia calva]